MARELAGVEAGPGGGPLDDPGDPLRGESLVGHPAERIPASGVRPPVGADAPEQRSAPHVADCQPPLDGEDGAGLCVTAAGDADGPPLALLVGLAPADEHVEPLIDDGEVV